MIVEALIKPGEYRDSVALMLVARELSRLPGVDAVSVVMGTPANKGVLQQAGLLTDAAASAGPNDLVTALRAQDDASADNALRAAQGLLAAKAASEPAGHAGSLAPLRPRSLRSAARSEPAANVAVISVPGEYAAAQAWDALRAGMHVLLFSDHVSVEDEIALKEYARTQNLLLMGPGAGTAILNGVGLGFANAVPRGPVGIVAAAGTGLQEVSTLLAKAGLGITQGIGTGGRDVSDRVGGIMLLEGLQALQADPETRVIVVVSKLPAAAVTDKIIAQVQRSEKPVVLALVQSRLEPASCLAPLAGSGRHFTATTLREAAALAAALAGGESVVAARARLEAQDRALERQARALRRRLNAAQRYVRGLYSGGTLCEEAMRVWQATLGAAWSNAPLDPRFKLSDSNGSQFHTAVDLGDEEFTQGRPHPMIDYTLRLQRLAQEARDPEVAVIVLDVVIGFGAHPDPAAELGPGIAAAKDLARRDGRDLIVVASVTGTAGDPQGLGRQTEALRKAGARVLESNAAAALLAAQIVSKVPARGRQRARVSAGARGDGIE